MKWHRFDSSYIYVSSFRVGWPKWKLYGKSFLAHVGADCPRSSRRVWSQKSWPRSTRHLKHSSGLIKCSSQESQGSCCPQSIFKGHGDHSLLPSKACGAPKLRMPGGDRNFTFNGFTAETTEHAHMQTNTDMHTRTHKMSLSKHKHMHTTTFQVCKETLITASVHTL